MKGLRLTARCELVLDIVLAIMVAPVIWVTASVLTAVLR